MNRRTMLTTSTLLVSGLGIGAGVHAAEAQSTGRPIRRKDRALTTEEAYEVIKHTPHAVLCTTDASGQPYGVPISPV